MPSRYPDKLNVSPESLQDWYAAYGVERGWGEPPTDNWQRDPYPHYPPPVLEDLPLPPRVVRMSGGALRLETREEQLQRFDREYPDAPETDRAYLYRHGELPPYGFMIPTGGGPASPTVVGRHRLYT